MKHKHLVLALKLHEPLEDRHSEFPRDHCDAGHPSMIAELIAARCGATSRAAVDHRQVCGPRPVAPPEDRTGSDHSAMNKSHYPTARRVAG